MYTIALKWSGQLRVMVVMEEFGHGQFTPVMWDYRPQDDAYHVWGPVLNSGGTDTGAYRPTVWV